MESKQEEPNISNTRLQALLQSLSKCKIVKNNEEVTLRVLFEWNNLLLQFFLFIRSLQKKEKN